MNNHRITIIMLAGGLQLLAAPSAGHAASADRAYPERPIRMVVPFPAGGGVDVVSRILAQEMTQRIGQQVIVDNRAGASGIVGTELVAKATPDGYTVLMGNVATHAVNVSLVRKLSYHPLKDFAPVTRVAVVHEILVVHPSVPATSVKELIALARSRPGQLTFGSAGNGTPPHLAGELFKSLAGVNILHVPYKGTPPALADLLGGQITMIFSNLLSALPLVRSGKLRALGVSSQKRSAVAPDVPTIAESGLPGYQKNSWYGVLAPAGTPAGTVAKLNQAIVQALENPATRAHLAGQGAEIETGSPEEFRRFIESEIERYATIIRNSGLRID
jgi:tripartite-type tricarboxylate transporter receptor subunit TctC